MVALDTQVLVWWVNGNLQRLSPKVREHINQAAQADKRQLPLISAISCWEVAMLVQWR